MKVFLFVFAFVISQVCHAQDTTAKPPQGLQTATVVVNKDPRIDLLIKKQASINTVTKKAMARTARGYRLLVINTNKREEAIAAKTKVYTFFPELKAYLAYQSPYFKLKAGNFQTRDEAVRYQKQMNAIFPKGVFIVNDIVEIKPEKEEGVE